MTKDTARPKSILRRADDALFATEQGLVAVMLVGMTAIVFLDVVYRQLIAPENEIAQWLAAVIDDAAVRAALAPWVGALLGLAVLAAGFAAAERVRAKPILPIPGSPLALAAITGAAIAALGYLMIQSAASSSLVYLVLIASALVGYAGTQLRTRADGWAVRLGVACAVGAALLAIVLSGAFPEGYTWSKEIAMTVTLWVGFFGASLCVHEGKHIRLEALEKSHPESAKRWLASLSFVIAAIFCAIMTYLGWHYVFAPGTGAFFNGAPLPLSGAPFWTRPVAIPILFGISTLRFLGAAASAAIGGSYGAAAKAEGMEEAEKLAAGRGGEPPRETQSVPAKPKRPTVFLIVAGLIVLLPLLGPGGVLASVILVGVLLAEPLFVVLGGATITAFLLWDATKDELSDFSILVERIVSISDNEALLAIPFFILSGAIMARGQISARLIAFARALVGWLPGGMAISAVMACMIFAAISGSSPATVVAIGGMMAPALIRAGYNESFSHGLVTSAGSLGILIPPSIPMIVYAIVNTSSAIRVEDLFASGFGPGFVIGGILMGYSLYRGVIDKTPRDTFSLAQLWVATREGFWSLMFPGLILGGIYAGVFNAVESACISVVYAIVIELFVHRALEPKQIPAIFGETAIMLGSFLVILVAAMSFTEFLETMQIPAAAGNWIRDLQLSPLMFLLVVNLLLLVVGCLMDIMSAIFVFVPLLAPMAVALGIDPLHFGIIFIVNLEIGYLTPPVGLNLFVASTLFNKPLTYLIRSVVPFIGLMAIGLLVITYVPWISAGLGRIISGAPEPHAPPIDQGGGEVGDDDEDGVAPARRACDPPEDLDCDGNVTMEEMTEYSEQGAAAPAPERARCDPPEDLDCDGNVTMEEMTEYSEQQAEPAPAVE